jgi:hypothetical protein
MRSFWEDGVESDIKGEHNFALRVKGDSMEPEFNDGDIVSPTAKAVVWLCYLLLHIMCKRFPYLTRQVCRVNRAKQVVTDDIIENLTLPIR